MSDLTACHSNEKLGNAAEACSRPIRVCCHSLGNGKTAASLDVIQIILSFSVLTSNFLSPSGGDGGSFLLSVVNG